jgi:peptidyl-Lys metalloendopeptidase
MSLKINLYSPDLFETGDQVSIIFELINTFDETINVLRWFTPLEGLRSDCLQVKIGQKIIRYDGIKVKRGKPTAKNFQPLKPGESIAQKIDLEEAYDLPLTGNAKISFDVSQMLAAKLKDFKVKGGEYTVEPKQKLKKLDAIGCAFKLKRTSKKSITFGEEMRSPKDGSKNGVTDPKLQGMSTDEGKKVKAAHNNGYALTINAIASLANDATYKKWFGGHTALRFAKVKKVFDKVKAGLETKQFTYINNGPSCDPGDIAYTSNGSDKIFICKGFWGLPGTGEDSQAGTIVHEHSHTSSATGDHAYGVDDCAQLAKDNPDLAVDNGDSYQFYSET